ncbi:MAG: nucleotidyltransferase domain-containing protein, partial [Desulfobacterales bacterium]|nr:nucleotidyltransferase domain-containing protein [Desulfobacterales bacterium]
GVLIVRRSDEGCSATQKLDFLRSRHKIAKSKEPMIDTLELSLWRYAMKSDFLDNIESICRRYHIDALYVFGSRAKELSDYACGRGKMISKKSVDADLGVLPAQECRLSVADRIRLTVDLEDLLAVCRVDLVILSEASPFLALDVIKGEQLFSADPDRAAEYELYILRKAGDLAYFERQRRRQILTGVIS